MRCRPEALASLLDGTQSVPYNSAALVALRTQTRNFSSIAECLKRQAGTLTHSRYAGRLNRLGAAVASRPRERTAGPRKAMWKSSPLITLASPTPLGDLRHLAPCTSASLQMLIRLHGLPKPRPQHTQLRHSALL